MNDIMINAFIDELQKLASLKRRHDVTMYHSSAHDVDLEPRAHRLTNNKPAVFGTPDRALSLTFIPKWSDSDINLSQYGDDHMVHIEEQTPNAIRKHFEGKSGYLYHMKPHGFKSQDNLMKAERVLYGKPKVLKKEHIPDVYQALMDEERKGNVKIHKHVKTAEAIAVKRDPQKWEQAKQEAKAKMGGKHSARAMQLAVKLYKDKGGTYSGKKPAPSNNSMRKWTKQDWQTRPGTPEIAQRSDGATARYLPKKKWDSLSHKQQIATDRKKLSADTQYIPNTSSAKVKGSAKYY